MESAQCTVVRLSSTAEQPAYPKVQTDRGGWIKFGADNLFPQEIIALNGKSPVNSSIVDSTVTYVCGKGVRDSSSHADSYVGVPNSGETWDELIEKIARDYKLFGGFYLQVIVNRGGTTVSLFHQDYSSVRIGRITDTGRPLTFRISNDWTKTFGKYKPLELPVWPGSIQEAKKGENYVYHHWDYSPGLHYYSLPKYWPAADYIRADGLLGPFYKNSIRNGFTPSVVISMPSNPDEEAKADFQRKMEGAFSGPQGASNIIVLWGENDTVKPQITPFNASANADIYNNVEGIIFQKIVSAHRLSSPTLAGVSGGGNLSGNAAEIIDAYVLYNYTVIAQLRRNILDHLNRFTKINRTSPLIIDDLDVVDKMQEQEQGGETSQEEKSSGEGSTEPSPAEEPVKMSATLRKRSTLRKLLQQLHKYIRRIPKPVGGYRYIYKESGSGHPARATRDKKSDKTTQDTPSEQDASPSKPQSETSKLRHKYYNQMAHLKSKRVKKTLKDGQEIYVTWEKDCIEHLYSDTFGRAKGFGKEDLKNLDKALQKSTHVDTAPGDPKKKNKCWMFYYFKDATRELYYNVGERRRMKKDGQIRKRYVLYSVTDKIKKET